VHLRKFDLNLLVVFDVIMKERSIVGASERLNLWDFRKRVRLPPPSGNSSVAHRAIIGARWRRKRRSRSNAILSSAIASRALSWMPANLRYRYR
jgi:hypothetical protein